MSVSALELDQALFARARWRLRILVPCWIFQILVLLCLMGIFAYRLAETFEHYSEQKQNGEAPLVEVVWEATNVAFSTLALVLSCYEVARVASERLTPFLLLCTQILKLVLAFAMFGLDIVVHIQGLDHHYSIVGLSLDCGFLAVTFVTFIYALLTFRRMLRYEDYALTANSHGFVDVKRRPSALELGNRVVISADGRPETKKKRKSGPISPEFLKQEAERVMSAEFQSGRGSGSRGGIVVASGPVRNARMVRTSTFDSDRIGLRSSRAFEDYHYSDHEDDDDGTETVRGASPTRVIAEGRIPTVVVTLRPEEEEMDVGADVTQRLLHNEHADERLRQSQ